MTASQKKDESVRPFDAISVLLEDANGTLYRAEHAGAWDPPEDSDRSGVYYEDEELPQGAVSLYRLYVLPDPLPRGRPTGWAWFGHVLSSGGFCFIHCPHFATGDTASGRPVEAQSRRSGSEPSGFEAPPFAPPAPEVTTNDGDVR